jgi:hypothetical protein
LNEKSDFLTAFSGPGPAGVVMFLINDADFTRRNQPSNLTVHGPFSAQHTLTESAEGST